MVGWHAMDTGESWMDGPFEWTPVNVGSRDQQQQHHHQQQQQQQSQQQQQPKHQQKARSPSLLGFSKVPSQLVRLGSRFISVLCKARVLQMLKVRQLN
jgi:hypothetical protein